MQGQEKRRDVEKERYWRRVIGQVARSGGLRVARESGMPETTSRRALVPSAEDMAIGVALSQDRLVFW